MKRYRPTLAQTFLAANVLVAALLGTLAYGLLRASEKTVLSTSEVLRRATSQLIVERMRAYFDEAERLASSIEGRMQLGLADPRDPRSVEAVLFAAGLDQPGLAGSSFTVAPSLGFDDEGKMRLGAENHWQMAVYREGTDLGGALETGWVRARGSGYVREVWHRRRARASGNRSSTPRPRARCRIPSGASPSSPRRPGRTSRVGAPCGAS